VSHVHADERGGALRLTLGRPPLNVLDVATLDALAGHLRPLAQRRDVKAVALRSALPGTFSAGADVADHTRERAPGMLAAMHGLVRLLDDLPQVTVALVDGRCLGGGCELALACDLVIASPRASFGQPEIDLACFPPVAAALLPRLCGRHAAEMVLLGEPVPADRAFRMGLVSRVTDDVDAEGERILEALARKSGATLALARRALRSGAAGTLADALDRNERLYLDELLPTEDAAEGVRAFLEKRPPRWSDR
jgi:cyclohexa-1,5-dienecarbonyl-CoA hydratase